MVVAILDGDFTIKTLRLHGEKVVLHPENPGFPDVEVPARTFITFSAPEAEGDYAFVSSPDAEPVDGFADTLVVRAP